MEIGRPDAGEYVMSWFQFREPASAWTHFLWLLLSFPATWLLWRLARGSTAKRIGMLVFGATLAFCYAGSFLYHSVPPTLARPFNTMDHIGIYLLIAGTVTPIGLIVLRGVWRLGLLGGIWAMAVAGISLRLTTALSIHVLTVFYLVMGWIGCSMYFELARLLTPARLRPLWIGGVLYSIGAVCNWLDWPVPVPGVFGSHEVFHVFVMLGTACHYYFILSAVLPYRPAIRAGAGVVQTACVVAGEVVTEPAAIAG
jgi:hemolysin III